MARYVWSPLNFFPEFLRSFLFNQTLQCRVSYGNVKGVTAAWVMLDTVFLLGSKLIKCLSLTHHRTLFFPLLYSVFSVISDSEALDVLKLCHFSCLRTVFLSVPVLLCLWFPFYFWIGSPLAGIRLYFDQEFFIQRWERLFSGLGSGEAVLWFEAGT